MKKLEYKNEEEFFYNIENFIRVYYDNILYIDSRYEFASQTEKNNGSKFFKVIVEVFYKNEMIVSPKETHEKQKIKCIENFSRQILICEAPTLNIVNSILIKLNNIIKCNEFLVPVYFYNPHLSILQDTLYYTNTDLLADIIEYLMRVHEFSVGMMSYITTHKCLSITIKLDNSCLPRSVYIPKITEDNPRLSDYFKEIYFEIVEHYNTCIQKVEEEKEMILNNTDQSTRLIYEVK